jgi:uncharacterized membrane protein
MRYNFISVHGMGWNLFLALIPLALALWLFRKGQRPGLVWALGFVAFVLFLPNAAYVLTDIVWFVRSVRQAPYLPMWTIALTLVPAYALFMLIGFQAHVLSLTRFGGYLDSWGRHRWILPGELALNLAAAVGVYLGRFRRFNSWDVWHDPTRLAAQSINDLTSSRPLQVIVITFAVIGVLYFTVKTMNRSLVATWNARARSFSWANAQR